MYCISATTAIHIVSARGRYCRRRYVRTQKRWTKFILTVYEWEIAAVVCNPSTPGLLINDISAATASMSYSVAMRICFTSITDMCKWRNPSDKEESMYVWITPEKEWKKPCPHNFGPKCFYIYTMLGEFQGGKGSEMVRISLVTADNGNPQTTFET